MKKSSKFDWYKARQRFSLRKFHFGAASVLLGTALFLGTAQTSVAQADEQAGAKDGDPAHQSDAQAPTDTEHVAIEPTVDSVPATPATIALDDLKPVVETKVEAVETGTVSPEISTVPAETQALEPVVAVAEQQDAAKEQASAQALINEPAQDVTAPVAPSNSALSLDEIKPDLASTETVTFKADDVAYSPASSKPENGVYATLAEGIAAEHQDKAAKLRDSLFFPDWSKATNLDADGQLQVGTELVVSPAPGYDITITVKKLQPFNSTEEYKKRLIDAGIDPATTNYDPNAVNTSRGTSSQGAALKPDVYGRGPFRNLINNSGYDLGDTAKTRIYALHSNGGVTFGLKATFNGKEVPVQAFITDGESIDKPEVSIVTTNGEPFKLVDISSTGVTLATTGSTIGKTVTNPLIVDKTYFDNVVNQIKPIDHGYTYPNALLNPAPNGGQGTTLISDINSGILTATGQVGEPHSVPILTTDHVTEISYYYVLSGAQAFIMGFVVPMDSGDAPESYGTAAHLLHVTGADTDFKLGDRTGEDQLTIVPKATGNPYLGTSVASPDDRSKSITNPWQEDDLTATYKGHSADEGEQQLTGGRYNAYKRGASRYALDVLANRNGAEKAYIGAWVDFNNNGKFDDNEKTSATLTADSRISLEFTTDHRQIPAGIDKLGVRVRIASHADEVANPTGFAQDGEVEDFQIPIVTPDNGLVAEIVESKDIQGMEQTGKLRFETGDPDIDFEHFQAIDPLTKEVTNETVLSATSGGKVVGNYRFDPANLLVTFTPNKDFVGQVDPLTVRATDPNGQTIDATYTPTVTPVTPTGQNVTSTGPQGQVQTGQPDFTAGDPRVPMDDNVPATFENGETVIVEAGKGRYQVASDGTVTFTPEKSFVGEAPSVTVIRKDVNGTIAKATYTPTVTAVTPTGQNVTSTGPQGQVQTGQPGFTAGDPRVPMDDNVPATFENGETVIVEAGKGRYQVAADGTVTFTPEKSFVGEAPSVTVIRKDVNGTIAKATYTPTVTAVTPTGQNVTSTGPQGQVQTGQPGFTAGDARVPMDDQTPPVFEDGTREISVPNTGTYVLSADGTVTFTPEKSFVGEAPSVTVIRKDVNGTIAKATYTPTVTAVAPVVPRGRDITTTDIQGQVQTGQPVFEAGDPSVPIDETVPATFDNGTKEIVVPNTGTYTVSADGTVTFTPEKSFVGEAPSVTVVRQDTRGTKATAKYRPTVTAVTPTGQNVTSTGLQGKVQTGQPSFTAGDARVPMDDKIPATFENGEIVIVEAGKGRYQVASDGTVTFTPEKSFVGEAPSVTVVRKDVNGTIAKATYTPEVTPVTPTSTNATSQGPKQAVQTGQPGFEAGHPEVPLAPGVTFEDGSTDLTVPGEGRYVVDDQGRVTFTPEASFVGTAKGVTLVRKDINDTPVQATYIPTVLDDLVGGDSRSSGPQGRPQSGTPRFDGGVPVSPATFDDGTTEKVVPGVGTYTVDPEGKVTFTPEKNFTGQGPTVSVIRKDKDGTPIKGSYTPEVTPVTPTSTNATSQGPKQAVQTGQPGFEAGHPEVPLAPGVTFEDGSTDLTVPGEGRYVVDDQGRVTFTPEASFVGTAKGVTLVRKDINDTPVQATYIPTVLDDLVGGDSRSSGPQGRPQSGTPRFDGGVPVSPATFDDGTTERVVPGVGTYTVDPEGKVTFTPEKNFTGQGPTVSVIRKDKDGTPIKGSYTPEVTPVTPTGTNATSQGPKQAVQTGQPGFEAGHPEVPLAPGVTFEDGSTDLTVPGEGRYVVDAQGRVTFTPEASFVGTAKGVTLVRKDINDTPVQATYIPTVLDDLVGGDSRSSGPQGRPQSGTPRFDGGVPVSPATFDDGTTERVVPGVGTYTVDPEGKVTFTPEKNFTGQGPTVSVIRKDKDGTPIKGSYTPEVTPVTPTGTNATSQGPKQAVQTGQPGFEAGHPEVPLAPGVTFEDGSTDLTVPGEGRYVVDAQGRVTFTPEASFVGTAKGVTLVRKDINDTPVQATYIPTVLDDLVGGDSRSSGPQGRPQSGTPRFDGGVPVSPATFDDGTTERVVPGVGTYTVDPEGKVTFTPEKNFTGQGPTVSVIRKDKDGTPIKGSYTPEVTPVTPTGTNATSQGPKQAVQTGQPGFEAGHPEVPLAPGVTFEDGSTDLTVPGEGRYVVDAQGRVTFTPEASFVGTAKGVTLVRKDINDTPVQATYIPTVLDDLVGGDSRSSGPQGRPQSGTPRFDGGVPVSPATFDDGTTERVVPGVGTYTVDPEGKVTFTPEKNFTGQGPTVSVIRKDKDGTPIKGSYTPEVTPVTPTGTNATSQGPKQAVQTGQPGFEAGHPEVPLAPGVTFEDGSTDLTVPGEGRYVVDAQGRVTFTPEASFVGTAKGVTLVRKDINDTPVQATYIPTVLDDLVGGDSRSSGPQGRPQSGTPRFDGGVPVSPATFDDGTTEKVVPGVGTYTVDPEGKVTFTPEKNFTGQGPTVSVIRKDKDGTPIKGSYTPEVTPVTPTSTNATSQGPKQAVQTGQPGFEAGHPEVPLAPGVTFEDGSTDLTVPGEGRYVVDAQGRVTFTPEASFVGTAKGVTLVRKDINDTPVQATYIPTVLDDLVGGDSRSSGPQGRPQSGTPRFDGGVPVSPATFDDGTTERVVPGVGTYTVDPEGKVTFTPEKNFTGQGPTVSVIRKDKDGTPIKGSYTPEVTPVTPTGTNATSQGPKQAVQTGQPGFEAGHPEVPLAPGVTFEDGSTDLTVPGEGRYVVDAQGRVTFTPEASFVGTAKGVTLVRKDINDTPVQATYIPTVLDDLVGGDSRSSGPQGRPQSGTPRFDGGVPVSPATFDDGTTERVVPGVGTYTVDPEGKVTFTPEKNFTGQGPTVSVIRKDKDGTPIKGSYTPEVTPVTPTGTNATSQGPKQAVQTGQPGFEAGHPEVPLAPGVTFEDGSTDLTVPGEGRYVVDAQGRVTFTPEASFVGTAKGVTLVRKDINDTPVQATYIPTVLDDLVGGDSRSSGPQGRPQSGTPRFDGGVPVSPATFDDGTTEKVVPGVGTYTVDPEGKVTFTPEKNFTGQGPTVSVIRKDKDGTPIKGSYTPEVTPVTPTSTNATSQGPKQAVQTGQPGFEAGHPEVPLAPGVTFEDGSTDLTVPGEGRYVVDAQGRVTFTPEASFVGTAKGVTLVRKDINDTPVQATYIPTVLDDLVGGDSRSSGPQGRPQSGTPRFDGGVPVSPATFDDGTTERVVPGVGTYTVDPEGKVTFTPEKNFTGQGPTVSVIRKDKDGTPIKGSYTPEVTPVKPVGQPAESTGVQGATQVGNPIFTPGHSDVPMDDKVPATFVDGTTTQTVPGEGTYEVAPDGTVTFKPELGFTGKARGVVVVRQDINGTPTTAHYVPNVNPAVPSSDPAISTGLQGQTQTGKPIFNSTADLDDTVAATFDDGSTRKVVSGEGTYEVAPDGTVTFTPEPQFVGKAKGVSVYRRDKVGTLIIATYTPEVTKAETSTHPGTSEGPKGTPQKGKPDFKSTVGLDDTVAATFDDGSTRKVVPGEGTYEVAPDGTVTFTPEPNFVGTAKGVTVLRKDKVGNTLTATYTPTVHDSKQVIPEIKQPNTPSGKPQSQATSPTGKTGSATLPQTGDESNLVMTLTGVALASLGLAGKRKREED